MDNQLAKEIEKLNVRVSRMPNSNEVKIASSKLFDFIMDGVIQNIKNNKGEKT